MPLSIIDREIKVTSERLKNLIEAKKKGNKFVPIRNYHVSLFDEPVYSFQCPRCKSFNTKRNGTTTQLNPKARFFCFDCGKKKSENEGKITDKRRKNGLKRYRVYFVLSNDEMIDIIKKDSKLSSDEKKYFLEKYVIEKKE